MNKRKKELVIIIPLIAVTLLFITSYLIPMEQEQIIIVETQCQEGWFQYETSAGTLCSKTELSERQIQEYG